MSAPAPGSEGRGPPPQLLRLANTLDDFIDRIGRWTSWTALVLVVLVATNVILRYMFRIGPVALQELEWHLMSPIALVGMSYAMGHSDHVRVDIVYEKLSGTAQKWIDFAAALTTVVISVVIFKLSLGFVEQAFVAGEVSPDPGGLPYRFALKAFIPLGFFLLFLQSVAQTVRGALDLAAGGRDG